MATSAAAPTPSHPAPRRSRLGAAVARRHNPLWRRTDTLRSRLRVLLVLAVTATAALAALLAVGFYHQDRAAAQRQAAALHRTQAVALTDADQGHGGYGAGFSAVLRWTDPSGATRQGRAAVDAATVTGAGVPVWLDSADRPTAPPTTAADSTSMAILLGGLVLVTGASLVLAGASLARSRLGRADLRDWEREWNRIEPAWTRRR